LQQRVQWALEWTSLADRAHQLAKTFSGGMKRRINIACSVLHEPQLLLLDEPTVGVDPQSRERIFAMLDELQREGAAILLTTHHLDEAQSIADRIVIIDRGQLVANGSFTQLVERTIGSSRWVTVRLDRPMVSSDWPVHLQFQPQVLRASDAHSPNNITVRISDLSRQLPEFLSEMSKAGYQVHDLQIESPSLHHVFMHLTGRSLRD
jgi:ABC-2 type transport system ATP-binding protein